MKTKRLYAKVTISALAAAAVMTIIIFLAYMSHKEFERTMVSKTQQQLALISKATAISLEAFISEHLSDLRAISKNPLFQEQRHDYHLLKILYEANKDDVNAIYLLDSNGIVLHRYPLKKGKSRVGENYSDRPGAGYVLREGKPYVSELFHSKYGVPSISISEPIFYEGKLVGIARWLIHLDTIFKRFIQPIEAGKKGYAQLLDDSGVMLAHPKPEHIGRHILVPRKEAFPDHDWSELENIVEKMTSGEEGVGSYYSAWWTEEKPEIVRKLTAYAPVVIGHELWSIGVTLDYSEIAEPIKRHAMNTTGVAGFAILILGFTGVALFRSQRAKMEFEAESKYLKEIAASAEALGKIEEKYRVLYENAREGILVAQDGMIKFPNPQALKLYDWPEEILTSKSLTEFIHEEDRQMVLERHQARLRGEKPPDAYPFRIVTRAGDIKWVELKVAPITWENKPAALCFMTDITARKTAEAEREKLISDLKEALANVKTLHGLLPVCANCKKIRDDGGYWNRIETYIEDHSEAEFSHSICPECEKELYPEFLEENE